MSLHYIDELNDFRGSVKKFAEIAQALADKYPQPEAVLKFDAGFNNVEVVVEIPEPPKRNPPKPKTMKQLQSELAKLRKENKSLKKALHNQDGERFPDPDKE